MAADPPPPTPQRPCNNVLGKLTQNVMDRVADGMNNEETRAWIKQKFIRPLLSLILREFSNYFYLFLVLLVLMIILSLASTCMLVYLLTTVCPPAALSAK
jgi:hypothetical protein